MSTNHGKSERGFTPPPGEPEPMSDQKYMCPMCDYVWYRPSVGMYIPTCPTHDYPLVLVSQELDLEQISQSNFPLTVLGSNSSNQPLEKVTPSPMVKPMDAANTSDRIKLTSNASEAYEARLVDFTHMLSRLREDVSRIQLTLSTEITDCPRLCTITPERRSGIRRLMIGKEGYRLVLWCEYPGHWHPWSPASYSISLPKGWMPNLNSPLMLAEGSDGRALRALLFKHDQLRAFGGMRRVQASFGDFLWVCADHYSTRDRGLPTVP